MKSVSKNLLKFAVRFFAEWEEYPAESGSMQDTAG